MWSCQRRALGSGLQAGCWCGPEGGTLEGAPSSLTGQVSWAPTGECAALSGPNTDRTLPTGRCPDAWGRWGFPGPTALQLCDPSRLGEQEAENTGRPGLGRHVRKTAAPPSRPASTGHSPTCPQALAPAGPPARSPPVPAPPHLSRAPHLLLRPNPSTRGSRSSEGLPGGDLKK